MAQVTFSKSNMSSPAPPKWKRWSDAVKYFLVSLITMQSVMDVMPHEIGRYVQAVSGFTILALKTVDMGLGYKQPEDGEVPLPEEKG